MKTTSFSARALLLAAAGALATTPAAAQDIEMAAQAGGRTLPRAYYDRVRQDPGFFEFKHAWTQRAEQAHAAVLEPGGSIAMATLPRFGEMRMAVVMALFSDSPEPAFSTEITHQQLFGDNPLGNLTDFYREISGGRVTVTGSVLPWTRTAVTRADAVGSSMGLGGDAQIGAYMVSALRNVDAFTNFAQYDNDGRDGIPNSGDDDGFVDLAVFQYPEVAASCGGDGPWPHRSSVAGWMEDGRPYATDDLRPDGRPVYVSDYIMQSVVNCDGTPQSIATIAHETGHAFGLPDFYHAVDGILPSQRRWVLGCWTLMAAGSWGCGDGASFGKALKPSHMGAFEKHLLGWRTLTVVDTTGNGQYPLTPVAQTGQIVAIPLAPREYLLVEYRPREGYDSELAAGGVLVYHVDTSKGLRPCRTCPRQYVVTLVEADGNGTLLRTALEGGNRGEAGDVFTGSTILTDRTTPSLRLNNGRDSNLALHIVQAGNAARLHVFRRATFPEDRVLGPMLGNDGALSADDQAALDAFGNGNGRYDLGDLRAHLRSADTAGAEPEPAGPQVP